MKVNSEFSLHLITVSRTLAIIIKTCLICVHQQLENVWKGKREFNGSFRNPSSQSNKKDKLRRSKWTILDVANILNSKHKLTIEEYRSIVDLNLYSASSSFICETTFSILIHQSLAVTQKFWLICVLFFNMGNLMYWSLGTVRKALSLLTFTSNGGINEGRCDFDHSHRGSGSTPSNSYFQPLGVLPVLLYHFCGSTSYEYSQWLFFNSTGVVPQVLYHFCGSTPTKVV